MGSNVGSRIKTGKVVGTAAEIEIAVPEFTPRVVKLINVTSGDEMFWADTMADATGFKRVAAGTGAMVTSLGITPVTQDVMSPPISAPTPQDPGRGFLIGADTDMNVAAQWIHWVAYE